MKFDSYEREVAFRAIGDKYCPGCGRRKYGPPQCFCKYCEKKLTEGILNGLYDRESFVWAYYEALKILQPSYYK